jgi:hypothetical protein
MNIIVEGGIDFYKQLYDENSEDDDDTNDNICLITKLPLDKNKIVLPCNHSFNFMPLYKDVYNQKIKTPISYLETNRLKYNQIKCPYCRNIFDMLLPHVRINKEMIYCNGINSPPTLCMPFHKCNHIFISGKNKNTQCSQSGYYEGDNCYCVTHHKIMSNKPVKVTCNKNLLVSTNNKTCGMILKTGKRVGGLCGTRIIDESACFCKRHSNTNIVISSQEITE